MHIAAVYYDTHLLEHIRLEGLRAARGRSLINPEPLRGRTYVPLCGSGSRMLGSVSWDDADWDEVMDEEDEEGETADAADDETDEG